MEITEVRIKLMEEPGERLQAFCSITFDDCFVIRDLKIIEGALGPFVAMPSRKLTGHCPRCGGKNHLRAFYCNQCGSRQATERAERDEEGRAKLYADIAHPINSACRELIQDRVIAAFRREIELSKQPGYTSRYDDFDAESSEPSLSAATGGSHSPAAPPAPADAAQIEPPQRPHGPHKAPSRVATPHAASPAGGPSARPKPHNDAFGAGIW